MKTLHTAYRVSDLERSLAFYRMVGFCEFGRVAPGDESLLVMLYLPDDGNVVTLELVHAPARGCTGYRAHPDGMVRSHEDEPVQGAQGAQGGGSHHDRHR